MKRFVLIRHSSYSLLFGFHILPYDDDDDYMA